MKILLVTEKCSREDSERDGGARLVETLVKAFGSSLDVMQFGSKANSAATWSFEYPIYHPDRFQKRIANGKFIADQIQTVKNQYTHLIFIHVSMQFALLHMILRDNVEVWTFPMFLMPSYLASGESVPTDYFELEKRALAYSHNILCPSHFEKQQLIESYSIPEKKICVVPRGINRRFIEPTQRSFDKDPIFCSVGSIKPQKNTLGLIRLFARLSVDFPTAKLLVVGPVQNEKYFQTVCTEIQKFNLGDRVLFKGYVPPNQLPQTLQEAHIHLSTSMCETFGRSIFETLALGIPNIARREANAALEFLETKPYIQFVDDDSQVSSILEWMLRHLSTLSSMAMEIGELYDDELLSRLIVANICHQDPIAISDFDGTLYHKEDKEKTIQCIQTFGKFPLRVLCSARPIHSLLEQLQIHGLEVDWIIGLGGAVTADGKGKTLWSCPLESDDVRQIEKQSCAKRIEHEGKVLQIEMPSSLTPELPGLRKEIYQDKAFISHWRASKMHAVHRLLRHLNWKGCVRAFGDGIYDRELLTYFHGTWVETYGDFL